MKLSNNNPFRNFKVTDKSHKDAINWFTGAAKNALSTPTDTTPQQSNSVTTASTVRNTFGSSNNEVSIGNMYVAAYDAKHKLTLPVWDSLPTFFILKAMPTMFQVLNIHYLPLNMRVNMLGVLTEFTNNKTINDRTRLRLSYNLISSVAGLSVLKDCIKNHLYDHYTSPLIKIDPENWSKIASLPTEKWHYKSEYEKG